MSGWTQTNNVVAAFVFINGLQIKKNHKNSYLVWGVDLAPEHNTFGPS